MKIRIDNRKFDLENILMSGQCFRVFPCLNAFICILDDRVIKIEQMDNYLEVSSNNNRNLKEKVVNYFDLNFDYDTLNKNILKRDNSLKGIVDFNSKYRILNQNPFEMLISYIISQNNRVSRISHSVNMISKKYGKKIILENKEYYLFPKINDFYKISLEELRSFGVGFRDKYIYEAINKIDEKFLNNIESLNTIEALNELTKIKGIGLKVASCILLFGFHRFDSFPIDTWVKKYISKRYKFESTDINKIRDYMNKLYKNNSGIIIQYMYNYERNKKNN